MTLCYNQYVPIKNCKYKIKENTKYEEAERKSYCYPYCNVYRYLLLGVERLLYCSHMAITRGEHKKRYSVTGTVPVQRFWRAFFYRFVMFNNERF